MGPRQRPYAARASCYLVEGLTPRHVIALGQGTVSRIALCRVTMSRHVLGRGTLPRNDMVLGRGTVPRNALGRVAVFRNALGRGT